MITRFTAQIQKLRDLPPLFFRLVLAYGFAEPASKKLGFHLYKLGEWSEGIPKISESVHGIGDWFSTLEFHFPLTEKTLPMAMPHLNAVMATATENIGYILLFLGLGTRLITIPMMFVMLVAISTVHLEHGFVCGDNGFEVPFYYFLMLFSLFVTGAGRFSLDALCCRRCKK